MGFYCQKPSGVKCAILLLLLLLLLLFVFQSSNLPIAAAVVVVRGDDVFTSERGKDEDGLEGRVDGVSRRCICVCFHLSLSLSLSFEEFRGYRVRVIHLFLSLSLSLSLLLLLSSQLNAGVVVAVGPGRPSPMDGKIIPNGTSSSNIHAHQTNHVSSLTLLLLRRRQNRRQSLTPGVWRSSRASRRRSAKERVPLIQRRGDSRDITGRIRKAHAPHSNTTIAVLTMISVDPTRTFSFLPDLVVSFLSFRKGCSPLLY